MKRLADGIARPLLATWLLACTPTDPPSERSREVVELEYTDQKGTTTTRRVPPLGLYFWGVTWTLGAWFELRVGFRNFRLDRISDTRATDEVFALEPPYTVEAFVEHMKAREDRDGA